ncbi:Putative teichuronic acid biosynthesis glycosyltransferase TuaC [Salinivirga cyanobacteriivorans]|uniref:Teichuronic acid biosynthesis glycosyltransferase TuaC n=1 Tax=Salinivirga cyanobacteriivorans TaxID=1307839 RepID=A0A0S2I0M8_9BACT|nr:glycosyltransferase [Salinivirga cyanobacteriivorans]ALO15778.1 Putative teichuronic acid biosynthesis glycosyltransferase TuaC [Salinivirga cyanobacteriivorans]
MKILCICSQNREQGISPVILNQINALKKQDVDFDIYGIKGKGVQGYLRAIFSLREFLKNNSYPIYHAHYGLSAIVATLAGARPLIVSLMGSDVKEGGWQQWLIKRFAKRRWAATITKSEELADIVGRGYCKIIPNGVDTALFKPMSQQECREKLNLEQNKTYVLFAANPERPEKNFALAKQAFDNLNLKQAKLIYLKDVPHNEIPLWMNAVDVVVLTSLWEGSPNVVKEAMACNRPLVVTNVGDVAWLCGDLEGCFVSGFDEIELSKNFNRCLKFSENHHSTKGRRRIKNLGLDANQQAIKIVSLYNSLLKQHNDL